MGASLEKVIEMSLGVELAVLHNFAIFISQHTHSITVDVLTLLTGCVLGAGIHFAIASEQLPLLVPFQIHIKNSVV